MKRENSPWFNIPEKTTVDEIMDRVWKAINANCACGGSGINEGCSACQMWHYICGEVEK